MPSRCPYHSGVPPTPAVSVVIPARDAAGVIGQQLGALAAQTHRDFEVVVADNGSTDGTADAVRAAAGPLDVRVVDASQRPGVAHARNVGIRSALAAKILFCDADDVAEPGWVAALADALDTVDLVGGRLEVGVVNSAQEVSWTLSPTDDGLPVTMRHLPYAVGANLGARRPVARVPRGVRRVLRAGGRHLRRARPPPGRDRPRRARARRRGVGRLRRPVHRPRPRVGLPAAAGPVDQRLGPQVRARVPGRGLGDLARPRRAARRPRLRRQLPRRRHADVRPQLLAARQPGGRAVLQLRAPRHGRLPARSSRRRATWRCTRPRPCATSGRSELLTDGSELPVFAFALDDTDRPYTVFDVSERLRDRGWLVPGVLVPREPPGPRRPAHRGAQRHVRATSPTCSSPTSAATSSTSRRCPSRCRSPSTGTGSTTEPAPSARQRRHGRIDSPRPGDAGSTRAPHARCGGANAPADGGERTMTTPFRGTINLDEPRLGPRLDALHAARGAPRRAQRGVHRPRRRGVLGHGAVGRAHRHAEHHAARRVGPHLHQLAHDRAVLPHPLVAC